MTPCAGCTRSSATGSCSSISARYRRTISSTSSSIGRDDGMGLLGSTLTAPILGPLRGVLWLARMIEEHVNAELYDESKIRAELTELELALDLNQIDLDEYEARESMLLRRLKVSGRHEVTEPHAGPPSRPHPQATPGIQGETASPASQ